RSSCRPQSEELSFPFPHQGPFWATNRPSRVGLRVTYWSVSLVKIATNWLTKPDTTAPESGAGLAIGGRIRNCYWNHQPSRAPEAPRRKHGQIRRQLGQQGLPSLKGWRSTIAKRS